MSPDFVASERTREREVFRAAAHSAVPLGRPRGVLTAEQAAARKSFATSAAPASGQALVDAPVRVAPVRADPEQAMRIVRMSLAAVLILVLCLLWIRQRRWK